MKYYRTSPGRRYPPGAIPDSGGVNFCVFTRHATAVELLLYEKPDSENPFQVISLDPELNRTFYFWHVYVEGLPSGISYTWRADGPDDIRRSGFRFDRRRELLDPWARAVTDVLWDRPLACLPEADSYPSMRAMVVDDSDYDWEGDRPLRQPPEESVIYELHVGGFTRHPSSGVANPGTFSGLVEKIPYLQELGVTVVELLPVMAFDEQDVPEGARMRGLKNYWGYSTHSFYSPHPGYCVAPLSGTHRKEFRDMVKELHRAGISIVLDVVFNHTAEGGSDGPVINFKGFANRGFYHLDLQDRSRYLDYTGCGNTVNCNHPLVARFIVECLEYWVREFHVDGFRFDLASVLARGEDGRPMYHAPVVWDIEFSDVLAYTSLIAEAWDAGGLYQVGGFPGFRWAEWNGRYRDLIRQYVRGDKGLIGELATRLTGSSDLYESSGRLPINSINFVTCHDGFTLYDLVSYNRKHNMANGEDNRDGCSNNLSWNCGVEGDTDDPAVAALRRKQVKNFMAILLLSHGLPMLLAGDEVLRTQKGNNNCYCQDNELSWFDWRQVEENRDILRFVREMIAFRKRHPCLMRRYFLTGGNTDRSGIPDVTWYGIDLKEPAWDDPEAQVLSYTLAATGPGEEHLHIILNMSEDVIEMKIPVLAGGRKWCVTIDTSRPCPEDIADRDRRKILDNHRLPVQPRSVAVLELPE